MTGRPTRRVLALAACGALAAREARGQASATPRLHALYVDRAHGEFAPPALDTVAARAGLRATYAGQPLTAAALRGSRVLYLRAPSKAFAAPEKAAVVDFVRGGGSLLLVLDEEGRQSLTTTGVNDLIAPFGMRLTPDAERVPNGGALATAGASNPINRADREVPYDGGRAVEGGTPFAYQLDRAGRPGRPFAAWTTVPGGGRVVVMGEGMASLFLGERGAVRLGAPGGPSAAPGSGWWGQDSRVFMEEVLAWLARR